MNKRMSDKEVSACMDPLLVLAGGYPEGRKIETELKRARKSELNLLLRVKELESKANRVCRWKLKASYWEGDCSGQWTAISDHPVEDFGFTYCPRCGGKIEVARG